VGGTLNSRRHGNPPAFLIIFHKWEFRPSHFPNVWCFNSNFPTNKSPCASQASRLRLPRTRDPGGTIKGLRHRFHLGGDRWNQLVWQNIDLTQSIRNDEIVTIPMGRFFLKPMGQNVQNPGNIQETLRFWSHCFTSTVWIKSTGSYWGKCASLWPTAS
jgi:hypothetical protein